MDWRQNLIIQVGFSGSFEESKRDVYYRNDPMKYVDREKKKKRVKNCKKNLMIQRPFYSVAKKLWSCAKGKENGKIFQIAILAKLTLLRPVLAKIYLSTK
ncbi:hypothetical protein CORT_0B03960 [Candida orthopsilosis Co 90-125]|uniref:Uncharacterized protein n=1 Tax=Candida orthopsilosis (strain 90-125) TaxID=1136231 RepID=H8X164_CANO9|nr:hypothetical protein CORT_0B03960 [Candida orthopsilosis Co 90-125]CCG22104.1 hypothetical protein CORT_0B03960 [Candida orthopsilosis Co 90-125]